MVVRVRNSTERTFRIIQGGDPFYADPRIGGKSFGSDGGFEITPGLDAAAEGLVVPWTTTSRSGLVIVEVAPDGTPNEDCVRAIVGPHHRESTTIDWLRMHSNSWDPVAEDSWLALGKRHILGAIGTSVDVELILEEATGASRLYAGVAGRSAIDSSASSLAEMIHFDREATCASRNTIFLNVYDLAAVTSIPNQLLCNTLVKTLGAFHAAVEVYGEEWSFYRQQDPSVSGVLRSRLPRNHSVHVYRQSINCGQTGLSDEQVWNLVVKDLSPDWLGGRYDLIHCNCIHFCEELLSRLGASPVPAWVKGLHETGAALFRVPWPFNILGAAGAGEDSGSAAPAAEGTMSHTGSASLPKVENQEQIPQQRHGSRSAAIGTPEQADTADFFSIISRQLRMTSPEAPPQQAPAGELDTLEQESSSEAAIAMPLRRPDFLPAAFGAEAPKDGTKSRQPAPLVSAFAAVHTSPDARSPRSDGFVSADEEEPLMAPNPIFQGPPVITAPPL